MAKIAPRIPDATATFEGVTIDDKRWRQIERAYGCKISPAARNQLHEATEYYVRFASFELEAAPVAQSRQTVAKLRSAAGEFAEALNTARSGDAGHYAIRLIGQHFVEPQERKRRAQRRKKRVKKRKRRAEMGRDLLGLLVSFDEACHSTLDDLDNPETHGHRPGTRWKQWIRRLTSIVRAHGLFYGARKDVDKQKTDRPSRFVVLVRELQLALPHQFRRHTHSTAALATAISQARRRNREE